MNIQKTLCLWSLLTVTLLFGHEGHNHEELLGRPQSWLEWIGSWHFVFLHFPIALINMTVISELLFIWYRRSIFESGARLMLIAGAFFTIPTAFLGIMYSSTVSYNGLLADFVWWHMWFGLATTLIAVITSFIREKYGRNEPYGISLFLLFLLVNVTGFLGGGMTFGPEKMYPPI